MIRPLLCMSLGAVLLCAAPAYALDGKLEYKARALHQLVGRAFCRPMEAAFDPEDIFRSWTISYLPDGASAGEEETITLIRMWCLSGAYNVVHIYYIHQETMGLTPLSFAVPSFTTEYENDDPMSEGQPDLTVVGFNSRLLLINSEFDVETHTITARGLGRGARDVSDTGTWAFNGGVWTLKHFGVDESYDGEINPQTLVDYLE